MDYACCLKHPSSFWLLIAPPAWGKTYRLLQLLRDRPDVLVVFVSPLRALANEFAEKTKKEFRVLNIETKSDWQKWQENLNLIIVTPETLGSEIERFEKMERPLLFILDEVHLYRYWGTTFREVMWESLINILVLNRPVLALTATMSEDDLAFFHEQIKNQVDLLVKIDGGNQKLLYPPSSITYVSKFFHSRMTSFVLHEIERKEKGTVLYFVPYRREAQMYESYFTEQGLKVLACVGGEASSFAAKLQREPSPDIIVATTVLSHGVNLPPLKAVILGYTVENLDFWVQMVGRGGRRGESYRLYSMDQFGLKRWRKLISLVKLGGILIKRNFIPWNE